MILLFDSRFREIKKKLKYSIELSAQLPRMKGVTRQHLEAKTWFQKYVGRFGEKQPDRVEVHLAFCLTKKAVYTEYVQEMGKSGRAVLGKSSFHEMWQREFADVKIPTVGLPLWLLTFIKTPSSLKMWVPCSKHIVCLSVRPPTLLCAA